MAANGIDRVAMRAFLRDTLTMARAPLSAEDRAWWTAKFEGLPGDDAPKARMAHPFDGADGLPGNWYHRDGGDGGDGGSVDGSTLTEGGSFGSLEAFAFRDELGVERIRAVTSATTSLYRVVLPGPMFLHDHCMVVAPGQGPGQSGDPDRWIETLRPWRLVIWLLVGAAVGVGWALLVDTLRRGRRSRLGHAERDREASDTELGAPINAADQRCPQCGYPAEPDGMASCPECGRGLPPTGERGLLRSAAPGWLRRVYFGRTLLVWSLFIGVMSLVSWGALVPIGHTVSHFGTTVVIDLQEWLIQIAVASGIAALAGAWMLAADDPRDGGSRRRWTLERTVRWMALATMAASVLQLLPDAAVSSNAWIRVAQRGALWGLLFAGPLLLIEVLGLTSKLGLRLPSRAIAHRSRFLRWVATIAWIIVVIYPATGITATALGPGPARALQPIVATLAMGMLVGVVGLAIALAGLWSILLGLNRDAIIIAPEAAATSGGASAVMRTA